MRIGQAQVCRLRTRPASQSPMARLHSNRVFSTAPLTTGWPTRMRRSISIAQSMSVEVARRTRRRDRDSKRPRCPDGTKSTTRLFRIATPITRGQKSKISRFETGKRGCITVEGSLRAAIVGPSAGQPMMDMLLRCRDHSIVSIQT